MRINKFEDVLSWQKGQQLFRLVRTGFQGKADRFFVDQIMRATLSITNNIAEGFDRGSDKELRFFLVVARGSCAEVRSMLHIALDTKIISLKDYEEMIDLSTDISKLLTGFIKKLETGDNRLETKK